MASFPKSLTLTSEKYPIPSVSFRQLKHLCDEPLDLSGHLRFEGADVQREDAERLQVSGRDVQIRETES